MRRKGIISACLVIIFMCSVLLNDTKILAFPYDGAADYVSSMILDNNIKSISEKLIRFHVVANSDEYSDQKVKLEIRDAILNKIGQGLSKCRTRQQSLDYLEKKLDYIDSIADDILSKNGKSYSAKAMLGNFNFPIKQYGEITLPEGEYTALKVVLGEGGGKNWWCVMFPPLCFIDITRGFTTKETDKELQRVLSKDEIKSITGQVGKSQNRSGIKIKFKSVEFIKKLLGI